MKSGRALLLRLAVALGATGIWWWLGARYGGIITRPDQPADKFLLLVWFMGSGVIWWVTLGLPAIIRWAESWGSLFWPSDASMEVRPQFSIAEAREKQGRYAEAIAEYRQAAQRFPDEVTPHLRIAALLLEKNGDPEGAIQALEAAVAIARTDDAFAILRHRLADLYVAHRADRAAAQRLLNEIQQRNPNSKHARAAADRLSRLQ